MQAVAERNSAEGRAQRSAAAQMKVKADLAQLEIKLQVRHHAAETTLAYVTHSLKPPGRNANS